MRQFSGRRQCLAALGLVLLIYLAALALLRRDVFWSPDEGIRYIMLRALAQDGLAGDPLLYQGAALDPEFQFYPSNNPSPDPHNNYPFRSDDGTIHWPWPIWFPLLAQIPFRALGTGGLYLIPLLCGWLTSLCAWRVVNRFRPELAPTAILLVGLGTPVWFYSLTFWEHTAATLLATLTFAILVARPPGRWLPPALVAPILIVATVLRLEMLAFALALALAWVIAGLAVRASAAHPAAGAARRSERGAPRVTARRALILSLAIVFGLVIAGQLPAALIPRHQSDIAIYAQIAWDDVAQFSASPASILRYFVHLPDIVINYAGQDGPALDGVWNWIALAAVVLCAGSAFARSVRMQAALLVPPLLILLAVSLGALTSRTNYQAVHGILLLAPYGALVPYVLPYAWRRRDERLLFASIAALVYAAIGVAMIMLTRVNWDGTLTTGLEWGPRYLLPLYPILALLALVAVQIYLESDRPAILRRAVAGVGIALLVVGFQYQVRGLWMLYNQKQVIANWQRALEARAPEPIVTDAWWLPASVATYYVTHPMFVLHPENASRWVGLAASHGVAAFTYASQAQLNLTSPTDEFVLVPQDLITLPGMSLVRLRIAPPPASATAKGD